MEKAAPHWCHFVWVVFCCDSEACGRWQIHTALSWHGVISSLQEDKLTSGGVEGLVGRGKEKHDAAVQLDVMDFI